jgi:hypothetical protein
VTPIEWAFLQNFHADHMNACVHCAEVRFSPITFRLYEEVDAQSHTMGILSEDKRLGIAYVEVQTHHRTYEEDKGR